MQVKRSLDSTGHSTLEHSSGPSWVLLAYSILGCVLAVLQCGAATNDFLPGWRQRIPLQVQIAQTTQSTKAEGQVFQTIVVQIQVTQLFQLAKVFGKNAYLILAQIELNQSCEDGEVALVE